jgi:rhamnulokinase
MLSRSGRKHYLAFDLGAESGRAVLGYLDSGILSIKEVHRFLNEPVAYGGFLHWDVARLWSEMKRAFAAIPETELQGVGVDTWGVDYALLGEKGELLQNPYHYRDRRTSNVMDEVFRIVPREKIYETTGIQFMSINTLYQLFAAKRDTPRTLASAERLVTIPDLFHYWLTGTVVCEFTNATTTQLVNPRTRAWATDLMESLGLPSGLPAEIVEPGTLLGVVRKDTLSDSAFSGTPVIAPATHDTGSAVAAIRAREGTAFLSSGTWSLVGIEVDQPVITPESLRLNFTNEGGVNGTTRLLKNVMGLWMLQGCRKSWALQDRQLDYSELMQAAEQQPAFMHLIDPDDKSFLSPPDMLRAIDLFCAKTGQASPSSPGAYVRAVLESLAFKYRFVIHSLEQLTKQPISQIRVIGGGSKNRLLNQYTADATGKTLISGPVEAAALGNLGVQILATGNASSLDEVRHMVDRSFPTETFRPIETDKWERHAERFQQYCEPVYA